MPSALGVVAAAVFGDDWRAAIDRANLVWYGMVEVCEGAPVAVSGWVLTDRHDVRPCAASSLLHWPPYIFVYFYNYNIFMESMAEKA